MSRQMPWLRAKETQVSRWTMSWAGLVFCLSLGWSTSLQAQTYSRIEMIEYHDDTALWVLGQGKKVTCVSSVPAYWACDGQEDSVISETTYDPSNALPLVSRQFGKTMQTLVWNTTASVASGQRGTVSAVKDGNNNVTTVSSWKRGIPRSIQFPATPEASSGATQAAAVNDHGWITSVNDELNSKTCYAYDSMGRITSVIYTSESAAHTCDTSSWTATQSTFVKSGTAKYGLPAGHWQQSVSTGFARKSTYFDALWRPVVVETFENTNGTVASATRSVTVQRYDAAGRQVFQSYPMSSLSNYASTALKGTYSTYDPLSRITQLRQDWEGPGLLTTSTEYLSGFRTRVTPPRGQGAGSPFQTTTSYLAWDQPVTDFPVAIAHPEGTHTDIVRDAFGKPTSLVRRNPSGSTSLTRSYVYDAHQQLCKALEPETGAALMGYDAAGNLIWSAAGLAPATACHATGNDATINPRKAVRTYDARNRLVTLSFPDGRGNQTWTYTPDSLANTIATDNSNGGDVVTNSYSYNRRRLIVGETFGVGSQLWGLGYAYSPLGHLSSSTTPGLVVDFAPNALGQPTQAGTYATAVEYFPNGSIRQFNYGNGIKHTLIQNARGLPDTSCDFGGSSCGASAVLHDSYDYDGHGNVLAITDGRTGSRGNRDMAYDALDRLTQSVSPMFGTANYGYDVLDNLRTVQVTGGTNIRNHTYLYDASNRLSNVTNTVGGATVVGLAYDVQGNLANRNGAAHAFDFGNRLREAGGENYRYDGHGRRVLAVRNGQNLYSVYGQDGTLRFQRDERTGKTIDYVHLGGSLVAQVENAIALSTPTLGAPGSSSTGNYTVGWTTSPIASKYQLQERLDSGSWSTIHDAASTSKAFTGKTAGAWGYRVRACSATTCGTWSPIVAVTVQLPPASIPSLNLPSAGYNGSFSVSWTAVSAATTYKLQERLGTGSWSTVHDAAGTSKAITGKAAGSWGYRVQACNVSGCGGWSAIGSVQVMHSPGSAPAMTVPASNITGGYTVSWSSVATSTGYELEERFGSGAWAQIHNAAATSKALSGKTTGNWNYRVRACNVAGCSAWSSTATVAVTRPPSGTPTVTAPATNLTGGYTVTWTAVTHAATYQVQERLGTGSWSQIHDAAGISRAVSGKTTGSWSYHARACNVAGCGGWSSMATTAVTRPPAVPVLNLPATSSNGSYNASWAAVAHATGYQLQERVGAGSWSTIHDGAGTNKALWDKTNGTYGYRTRACNASGCSGWTAEKSVVVTLAVPTAAPGLSVETPVNEWQNFWFQFTAVAHAHQYRLERRPNAGGSWVQVGSITGTNGQLQAEAHGMYRFRARACNAGGCGPYSAEQVQQVRNCQFGCPGPTSVGSEEVE